MLHYKARHAESCNVDAVAVMPPSYFKPASAGEQLWTLSQHVCLCFLVLDVVKF